jgi:hypothetical protein
MHSKISLLKDSGTTLSKTELWNTLQRIIQSNDVNKLTGINKLLAELNSTQIKEIMLDNFGIHGSLFETVICNGNVKILDSIIRQLPYYALDGERSYPALAAKTGHIALLERLLIETPFPTDNFICYLFSAAACSRNEDMLNYVFGLVDSATLHEKMIAYNNYEPFYHAACNLKVLTWFSTRAQDRLSAMIQARNYRAFIIACHNNKPSEVRWLLEQSSRDNHVSAMIAAQDYQAVKEALNSCHGFDTSDLVTVLMTYPATLDYLDKNLLTFNYKVDGFFKKFIAELREQSSRVKAENSTAMFDVNPQKAEICSYAIKYFTKCLQNSGDLIYLDNIRYLCSIPAVSEKNDRATNPHLFFSEAADGDTRLVCQKNASPAAESATENETKDMSY